MLCVAGVRVLGPSIPEAILAGLSCQEKGEPSNLGQKGGEMSELGSGGGDTVAELIPKVPLFHSEKKVKARGLG